MPPLSPCGQAGGEGGHAGPTRLRSPLDNAHSLSSANTLQHYLLTALAPALASLQALVPLRFPQLAAAGLHAARCNSRQPLPMECPHAAGLARLSPLCAVLPHSRHAPAMPAVWDQLFFEGSPVVLFRVALALVEIYDQVRSLAHRRWGGQGMAPGGRLPASGGTLIFTLPVFMAPCPFCRFRALPSCACPYLPTPSPPSWYAPAGAHVHPRELRRVHAAPGLRADDL